MNTECQANPIFIFQKCHYVITRLPLWLWQDVESYWINYEPYSSVPSDVSKFIENGEIVEKKLFEYLTNYEGDGDVYCVKTWQSESVWLDRKSAEDYGRAHDYNYLHGWRVFCASAKGKLAKILEN